MHNLIQSYILSSFPKNHVTCEQAHPRWSGSCLFFSPQATLFFVAPLQLRVSAQTKNCGTKRFRLANLLCFQIKRKTYFHMDNEIFSFLCTCSIFNPRLHPIAYIWVRVLNQDVVLSGYNVPSNVSILSSFFLILRYNSHFFHFSFFDHCYKVKVKAHTSQRPKGTGAYPGFLSIKHAQEYCYSPLDGMLVHRMVTHQQNVAGTHLYTGRRETRWSKAPCLRKQRNWRGLNLVPLDPEFEVLNSSIIFSILLF